MVQDREVRDAEGNVLQVTWCREPGCPEYVRDHAWGRIKASDPDGDRGWFFSAKEEGVAWCPEHLPDWVVPWRRRQRERAEERERARRSAR